jgi:hypothetical protein
MPPTPDNSTHPVWPYFAALALIALIVIVIPMIRGRVRTQQEERRQGTKPESPTPSIEGKHFDH